MDCERLILIANGKSGSDGLRISVTFSESVTYWMLINLKLVSKEIYVITPHS